MSTLARTTGGRTRCRRRSAASLAAAITLGLIPLVGGALLADPPAALASITAAMPQQPAPAGVDDLAQVQSWPRTPPRGDSPPTVFQIAHDPPPARDRLRVLAIGIGAAIGDLDAGRYAYLHTRQWASETAPRLGAARAVDEQRWRAADGSGRVIATRFPARQPGPAPNSRGKSTTYPPGELPAAMPDPLTSDPAVLARQIDAIQPPENGPQGRVRAVNEINAWQVPTLAVRRAILTVLRDTDGLHYRGLAVDRAGRVGVAISVDSEKGVVRDVLILHPHTGELLAYEMVLLRDPGRVGITQPTVVAYELYLYHGRRLHTRAQPPGQAHADMDGLSYRDGATDRLGRTGAADSLTHRGVQFSLIFDTATGHLLASEQRSVGAHEYLDVPHGLVRDYDLFIEQSRRSGLD